MNETNTLNSYLYVLDTLADWEIGYLTSELYSKRYTNNKDVTFTIIGNSKTPIKTKGGMTIIPDEDINDISFKEGDLIILAGADTWRDKKNQDILSIIEKAISNKVIVAAISNATEGLAYKGLLNNKKHTSNNLWYLKSICPLYSGSNNYVNEFVVVDDNLITGSGLDPIKFSYEVFKKTGVMKEATLEAWYKLYTTKESMVFLELLKSLE
jgi:putative intracellular protease/amidase